MDKEPLIVSSGLLSYSGIKGCYFIEAPALKLLEKVSLKLKRELKAEKIKAPLFLPSKLLLLESSFRDFTKECFRLEKGDKYLKPTSELLLLEKLKTDIFKGKQILRYYMDGSVFRNQTKQNEPGVRHDEIMFFMEGHFF